MDRTTVGWQRRASSVGVGFTIVAALVGLLTGGLGMVMYLGAFTAERTVHRLHDIAPALMLLLVFAAGCVALLMTGGRSVAAMQQLIVGVAALASVTIAGGRFDPVVPVLVALVALLAALHPARRRLLKPGSRPNWLLAGMAIAGSIPLAWFALVQVALQRSAVGADAHGIEFHYAGMAATALAFALVALVASLGAEGWRGAAWTAALGIGFYGIASLATPRLPGSFGTVGAATAVVGAAAFLVAAEVEARGNRSPSKIPGAPGAPGALEASGTSGATSTVSGAAHPRYTDGAT